MDDELLELEKELQALQAPSKGPQVTETPKSATSVTEVVHSELQHIHFSDRMLINVLLLAFPDTSEIAWTTDRTRIFTGKYVQQTLLELLGLVNASSDAPAYNATSSGRIRLGDVADELGIAESAVHAALHSILQSPHGNSVVCDGDEEVFTLKYVDDECQRLERSLQSIGSTTAFRWAEELKLNKRIDVFVKRIQKRDVVSVVPMGSSTLLCSKQLATQQISVAKGMANAITHRMLPSLLLTSKAAASSLQKSIQPSHDSTTSLLKLKQQLQEMCLLPGMDHTQMPDVEQRVSLAALRSDIHTLATTGLLVEAERRSVRADLLRMLSGIAEIEKLKNGTLLYRETLSPLINQLLTEVCASDAPVPGGSVSASNAPVPVNTVSASMDVAETSICYANLRNVLPQKIPVTTWKEIITMCYPGAKRTSKPVAGGEYGDGVDIRVVNGSRIPSTPTLRRNSAPALHLIALNSDEQQYLVPSSILKCALAATRSFVHRASLMQLLKCANEKQCHAMARALLKVDSITTRCVDVSSKRKLSEDSVLLDVLAAFVCNSLLFLSRAEIPIMPFTAPPTTKTSAPLQAYVPLKADVDVLKLRLQMEGNVQHLLLALEAFDAAWQTLISKPNNTPESTAALQKGRYSVTRCISSQLLMYMLITVGISAQIDVCASLGSDKGSSHCFQISWWLAESSRGAFTGIPFRMFPESFMLRAAALVRQIRAEEKSAEAATKRPKAADTTMDAVDKLILLCYHAANNDEYTALRAQIQLTAELIGLLVGTADKKAVKKLIQTEKQRMCEMAETLAPSSSSSVASSVASNMVVTVPTAASLAVLLFGVHVTPLMPAEMAAAHSNNSCSATSPVSADGVDDGAGVGVVREDDEDDALVAALCLHHPELRKHIAEALHDDNCDAAVVGGGDKAP